MLKRRGGTAWDGMGRGGGEGGGSGGGSGGRQTLLAAESSNARRLLQVKMRQSCLKSG